jgi:N utilization substance protein B
MQQLFAWDFHGQKNFSDETTGMVIKNLAGIDLLITQAAPERPLDKINKLDLAILRLAVYELTLEPNTPPKVVVNEAVELAKDYGSDSSPGFINGVLGKIIKDQGITI